jgi:hypothetical protein
MSWATALQWLMALLKLWKLIPDFIGWVKSIFAQIQINKIKEQRKQAEEAVSDLKKAETPEDIDAAAEKLGKSI